MTEKSKSFDECMREADNNRRAAAKTLGEFLIRADYEDTGNKLLSGETVHIHEVAVCIRKTENEGLREAMRRSVERYADSRSEKFEYEVKSEIVGDVKTELKIRT